MKIVSKLLYCNAILFIIDSFGQHDPQFTQYMFNTVTVNPAYAGSKGHKVITALGRMQWIGFEGAPVSQYLTYDAPIGSSGFGLGINLINDKIGPSNEMNFNTNISYKVIINEQRKIAFGLRLGGRVLNTNWAQVNVIQEESLYQNNVNGKLLPTIGTGVFYYDKKWYIGLSVPNFLRTEYYNRNNVDKGIVTFERMHFYFITGYVFDLNETIKFKPATLVKGVSGSPLSLDISVNFLFNDKFRMGMSWRWRDSISTLVGFQVSNSIIIGYAYDLTTSNYNIINNGTHEMMLRFEILKKTSNHKSPRFF